MNPCFLLLLSCLSSHAVESTEMSQVPFDAQAAQARLGRRLSEIPPLVDAQVTRLPEYDLPGLFAFSVLPSLTGLAGEVSYLVGPTEMLSSGRSSDFDRVMALQGVGSDHPWELGRFCPFYMRFRAIRRGVVLDRPDGHVLLKPGQIDPATFEPPHRDIGTAGTRYRFWFFDTDRMKPSFCDVLVGPDGRTTGGCD
jgi:hypothetical protein